MVFCSLIALLSTERTARPGTISASGRSDEAGNSSLNPSGMDSGCLNETVEVCIADEVRKRILQNEEMVF